MRKWLDTLDQWIRQGRSRRARTELEQRLSSRGQNPIERRYWAEIAALCRRSGIPQRSVSLLHPAIKPKPREPLTATPEETLEYGASLIQIGGVDEGLKMLSELDPQHVPQALLFSAFAHFSRWDYETPLPLLRRYVEHSALNPYQRQIGQVNLGAALVSTDRHKEAIALLLPLIEETRTQGNHLLEGTALLLMAQSHVATGNWQQAKDLLENADRLMKEVESLDAIYVRKWAAILEVKREGASSSALGALRAVRDEAISRQNWETVRDVDFHLGQHTESTDLLRHVYFGTPYEAYRREILKSGRLTLTPETSYLWNGIAPGLEQAQLQKKRKLPHLELDPMSGETSLPGVRLKQGQILQRLLRAISSDFYRPLRLPSIHQELFPERHYNPQSSPNVIHQAVHRLNSWFRENEFPVAVQEISGAYRIHPLAPCWIRCSLSRKALPSPSPTASLAISQMLEVMSHGRWFTRAELATALETSERSASRILQESLKAGLIEREGQGPKTRYRALSRSRL